MINIDTKKMLYCKNCGQGLGTPKDVALLNACPTCHVKLGAGKNFCPCCGFNREAAAYYKICPDCHTPFEDDETKLETVQSISHSIPVNTKPSQSNGLLIAALVLASLVGGIFIGRTFEKSKTPELPAQDITIDQHEETPSGQSDQEEVEQEESEEELVSQSSFPVCIADKETMAESDQYTLFYIDGGLTDNTGTVHRHSYCLASNRFVVADENCEKWADYYLGKKYSAFSGQIGVSQESKDANCSVYIDIYADGQLIYSSPVMDKTSLPVDFSIDVSDVSVLRISYPKQGDEKWSCRYNDIATIYDGMLTPISANE